MIEHVVHGFYSRVRQDPDLGPIFDRRIAPDQWEAHLARMVDFWSSVLRMTGRYKGKPLPAHMKIREARAEHFQRWLMLFGDTVVTECPPDVAEIFIDRASRIAQSLQLAMFYSPAAVDGPASTGETT